jgi:hypothetical protein
MATQAIDHIRERALSGIQKLAHRAEDQQDAQTSYSDNFVRIVDFERLAAANTEILFGRNGTGKTHLLRAFEQHCYANFETTKVLPVYIDCRVLDVRSLGSEISLDRLLTIFYKRLIRKILTDLKQFSDAVITVPKLERIFGGQARDRRNKIDASFTSLLQLLDEGVIDESIKTYVRKVESERDGSAKIGGGIGISAKVSEKEAHGEAKVEGQLHGGVAWKSKKKLETIYSGLAVIDYDLIRSHIVTIIENAGAKSVIVLIDEWSDLPRDVQPLIAEMIRKTLGTSGLINLKVAALKFFCWPSAALEDGQRIGLTRANLSVLADLDALLRFEAQDQAVKDFLTLMLYKHVVAIEPQLAGLGVSAFEAVLCDKVFEGEAAYQELIRSSEGNPRDFLRLLGNCSKSAELDAGKRITERAVLEAAISHFQNDKQPEIAHSEAVTAAFDKLFRLVTTKGSKLFAVSSAIAEKSDVLRELWHYRFIHLVHERLPIFAEGTASDYDIYAMDYGKLLSLKLTREGEKQFKKIEAASELLSTVLGNSLLAKLINLALKSEKVGGVMRKMLGRSAVAEQGVERGSFGTIEQLITGGCVADEILLPAETKPASRAKTNTGRSGRRS